MRLNIDVALDYTIEAGDPVLLMVEARSDAYQKVLHSSLNVRDAILQRPKSGVVWAMTGGTALSLRYTAQVEITRPASNDLTALHASPLPDLPGDILPYLQPSRYCQSDLFTDFVQETFGALDGGAKVAAICDWVTSNVAYVPCSSDGATTAYDTFESRQGVCRDYAHLLCTLLRAALIPARYASVYGADVQPPDFHAIVQVWLNGGWHPVDAADMGAARDMAVIAVGRDAADVAFMETALWAEFTHQSVRVTRA